MTTTAAPGLDLHDRYGDSDLPPLALSNETLTVQLAHRSVRSFLPDPVGDEHLEAMVAAAQSAPTSSNLQAWSVVAVRDPAHRSRLAALAAEQRFVEEAPLLLVWLADLGRARRLAARHERPLAGADYLESTFLAFLDATLAAQNAVVAAESLGLGTVCVGAIRNRPEDVARELDLPPHVFAVFGLAVGWPDPDERSGVKPRLPQSAVVHREATTQRAPTPRSTGTTSDCARTTVASASPAAGPSGSCAASPARAAWRGATGSVTPWWSSACPRARRPGSPARRSRRGP